MKSLPRNGRLNLLAYLGLVLIHVVTLAHEPTRTGNLQSPTRFRLDPNNPDYQVTERGPHYDVIQRLETTVNDFGQTVESVASYTKLGSSLNYYDDDQQQWLPSQALIEAFETGAIARHGQTKVIFSNNLGDPAGTVDIQAADGQRFRSVVLGLAYYDPISGDDVILSEVNPDVVGHIAPPNQVVYPDAFTDIQADIVYEYRRSGFSQNIILRQRPPDPALIGFSAATRLEVLSEFLEAPQPRRTVRTIRPIVDDSTLRQTAQEPDLIDETLEFGAVSIGPGRAFNLQKPTTLPSNDTVVVKRYETVEGRKILFEGVEVESAKQAWEALPEANLSNRRVNAPRRLVHPGLRGLPKRAIASVTRPEKSPHEKQMAVLSHQPPQSAGYLIDYELLSGSVTNHVFKAGETYLIDGGLILSGTTVFEPSAVIKHGASVQTYMNNEHVDFQSTEFSPVVITSRHDDSIGTRVAGSLGTPLASPYEHNNGITIGAAVGQTIQNLDIRYCRNGIWINGYQGAGDHTIRNVRISNCYLGIVAFGPRNVKVENVLLHNTHSGFYTRTYPGQTVDAQLSGTNITMHDVLYPVNGWSGGDPDELTNSLLAGVYWTGYSGRGESHNVELSSSAGVFQTAGGGTSYLATNSPYRDIGTSTINPELKNELERRTTHPPSMEYSTLKTLTSDLTMTPHVPRDDDGSLDIGYHYPAIDYIVYHLTVNSGVSLNVEAGTQFAVDGQYFLIIDDGAEAYFRGTVLKPISIGWYRTLQGGVSTSTNPYTLPGNYQAFLPFDKTPLGVDAAIMHLDSVHLYAENFGWGVKRAIYLRKVPLANPGGCSSLRIRDCQFHGLHLNLDDDLSGHQFSIVNNLFLNADLEMNDGQQSLEFYNNEMVNTHWDVSQVSGSDLWRVHDNVFDSMDTASQSTLTNTTSSHNAYHDTPFRVQGQPDTGDVVMAAGTLTHVSGPFGNYYQPTSSVLIDAGSRLADAAGLLHHTVLANGQPEGTSTTVTTVDIGLHYPAVANDSGVLLDSDWDGFPNIVEDPNGNGTTEAGESLWKAADSPHVTGPGSVVIFNLSGSTL